jgi:hypothetical protein
MLTPATSFNCSGWAGPELGLGAGLGGVVRLNSRLDVIPQLGFRDERLTSNEVDGCASGVGSTASFSAGVAVAYGFDGPKGGSGP